MPRLKYSLLAVAGIVLLAVVLSIIGPKRALAALGYTPIMDVENPGLHPFQTRLYYNDSFRVPAKQRLVIDTVDGQCNTTGDLYGFILNTKTNGYSTYFGHPFPATLMVNTGYRKYYTMTHHVQLYADPGTIVDWSAETTGDLSAVINISGHLVDIP